ncbi:MAG TPA: hypothetical protein ENJ19_00590 [Gammaproteobacteria bacterium]|nr:hypothetical protein [Gammaproteobacteria bacterium]
MNKTLLVVLLTLGLSATAGAERDNARLPGTAPTSGTSLHVGVIQKVDLEAFTIIINDAQLALHPRARVKTALSNSATVYELRPGMQVRAHYMRSGHRKLVTDIEVMPPGSGPIPRRRP